MTEMIKAFHNALFSMSQGYGHALSEYEARVAELEQMKQSHDAMVKLLFSIRLECQTRDIHLDALAPGIPVSESKPKVGTGG